jgi:glycosyltransferase involved in cell wall biosynthesis
MPNVLHAVDFYNRSNTGITFAITSVIEQCRRLDKPSAKYAMVGIGDVDVSVPRGTTVDTTPVAHNPIVRPWRYSRHYRSAVRHLVSSCDISVVHVHGAWMYPQFAAVREANKQGIPILLTNHGLFERTALQGPGPFGALKKRTYLLLMDRPMFRHVDIFHAISLSNRDMLHKLFPWARVEYIPNSVHLETIDAALAGHRRSSDVEPFILFVGRLSPEKGVDLLVRAFGYSDIPLSCKLVLVGPTGPDSYAVYLRRLISESPCKDRIEWRGPIWDEKEKLRLMANAWLLAVPSQSEALGLVNLEASACRTPTVTTFNTGLSDWTEGGGILIDPTVAKLKQALNGAMAWDEAERAQRGEASRKLVAERYSTLITGPRWMELYARMRG